MHDDSGFVVLVGVPFIAILIMGVLRLDEQLVAPRERTARVRPRQRFSYIVEEDEVSLADPDGRAVDEQARR